MKPSQMKRFDEIKFSCDGNRIGSSAATVGGCEPVEAISIQTDRCVPPNEMKRFENCI